jgi:hypothetical protein
VNRVAVMHQQVPLCALGQYQPPVSAREQQVAANAG